MSIYKKTLIVVSQLLLGLTFVFSGFVKSVDPLGTVYKLNDYFNAFHLHQSSILTHTFSFILCGIEFILGVFLLLGIYRRMSTSFLLVIMTLMSAFTLYLALKNPVSDCGCFGDALVLTNWQTFFKNIILWLCAICAFSYKSKLYEVYTKKTYWLAALYILIFIVVFIFRNYIYSPIYDFRPYKIGSDIAQKYAVKNGEGHKEKTILVYSKNGHEQSFTQNNYPWQDSTWHFVRRKTIILSQGKESDIEDFSITKLKFNRDRKSVIAYENITNEVLSDSSYIFLMVTPSLRKMDISPLVNLEDIRNYAYDHHYKFYCLTASDEGEIVTWAEHNLDDFHFCTSDKRILQTIFRSNPGLLLMKRGVVVNKWSCMDIPEIDEFKGTLESLNIANPYPYRTLVHTILICAIFFVPLIGIKELDLLLKVIKKIEKEF